MNYFACPKQLEAEDRLEDKLAMCRHALITGSTMSGKTTLVKKLSAVRRSSAIRTVFIDSCQISTFPSLQHAFSSALGIPVNAGALRYEYFVKVLEDLGFGSIEYRVFIDDLDVFFGGHPSSSERHLFFVQDLISRFNTFRLVGTYSSARRLKLLRKYLQASCAPPVEISVWAEGDEFERYVKSIAIRYGLHPNQVVDERFLKELLTRSKGAAGSIIKLIQAFSYDAKYADRRVLTPECFSGLWRY